MRNCRILGVDNSTKSTGWSVIDVVDGKLKLIDYGCIERHGMDVQEVLVNYEHVLNDVLRQFKPDYIAAEQMFVSINRLTAMRLAQVHGVMLLTAKKVNVPVVYYSVMTLKSKVLGGIKAKNDDGSKKTGAQMKLEVQAKVVDMLGRHLFIKEYNDDVTDSMSAAITFFLMDGLEVEKKPKKKAKAKTEKVDKPKVKSKVSKSKVKDK